LLRNFGTAVYRVLILQSTNDPSAAAQPGVAVDRFACEIGLFLKLVSGALAATERQPVGRQPSK